MTDTTRLNGWVSYGSGVVTIEVHNELRDTLLDAAMQEKPGETLAAALDYIGSSVRRSTMHKLAQALMDEEPHVVDRAIRAMVGALSGRKHSDLKNEVAAQLLEAEGDDTGLPPIQLAGIGFDYMRLEAAGYGPSLDHAANAAALQALCSQGVA